MKLKITILFLLVLFGISCSKDEEPDMLMNEAFSSQQFVGKIIPDDNGYWLITRNVPSLSANYFANSINFIDGLTYFTESKSATKSGIGYIYDAEIYNNALAALTSKQILSFNKSLQSSIIKEASSTETFKLMDKDASGKIWVLSNKSIFSLNGDVIVFPNKIQAIDFEVSDQTFWIASSDTVYQVKMGQSTIIPVTKITGPVSTSPTIYSLRTDKSNNVWVNTSEKLYKLGDQKWTEIKVGNFIGDNFKTIPFMDIDTKGNLWMAEKNYQSFTTLHSFNGTIWSSYKLEPKIESWVNDIETADPGIIWIASSAGLRKLNLN